MRILVIEDEPKLADYLKKGLSEQSHVVDVARDGVDGRHLALEGAYDLIVLDVMLPGVDGFEILASVRAQKDTPILMLTARDAVEDRVRGLEGGADDYLVKPFAARELLARINAVLRRTRMLPPNLVVSETGRLIRFGRWRLDTTARHLLDEDDTLVALSGAEYRLLRVFLDHPQRVLNRDQLLNLTQGRDADLFDRSIDLLVSRLRQRLLDDAREPAYIKTVRSEGYVFSLPVEILGAEQ